MYEVIREAMTKNGTFTYINIFWFQYSLGSELPALLGNFDRQTDQPIDRVKRELTLPIR